MKKNCMLKDFNFFVLVIFIMTLPCTFTSCKKKQGASPYIPSGEIIQLEVKETSPEDKVDASAVKSHGHAEDGEICVLFGYGFNEENFYTQIIKKLDDLFGLEEDGGIIFPVLFPDAVKNKISNIRELLDARKIKGVVLLGAPEGSHYVFARLQDEFDGTIPYPVFSLFPQDDILGQESTCDFVLEYERKIEEESVEEEILQQVDSDAADIITKAISFMENLDSRLNADADLHNYVQNIVGNRKVLRYTDSETGIQSSNHFIIERSGSGTLN